MPRTRHPKTRVQLLAEALEALQVAEDSLAQIDLRTVTVKGDLRAKYSAIREPVATAKQRALAAIQSDVPDSVPSVTRHTRTA